MTRRSVYRYSVVLVTALASSGCVSGSVASDVARVREVTQLRLLPEVADAEVELDAKAEVLPEAGQALDVEAAVRLALLNNRELRATLRELGIVRGRVLQAGLLPNPIVEGELQPERDSVIELRVEYDLKSALLAPLRQRAVAPELEAARHHAAASVVQLGYRVRAAFYQAQCAIDGLGIAQRSLDALAAARDATRAMDEAGNIAALERASREASFERGRIVVAELELRATVEKEALQQLLGTFGTATAWQFAGALGPAPARTRVPERLETAVLRASFELLEARQKLEALARQAGVTRVDGWLPDVSADVHALLTNPTPEAASSEGKRWRFGAGVNVRLPVFNRNQGMSASLEAEFDAGLERYLGMAVDLRSRARLARARVVSAHARARQFHDVILPALRRVSDETQLQYNAMQLGIFHLLAQRREVLDVELAEVETRREYWSAVAELGALLAGARVDSEGDRKPVTNATASGPTGGH